MPAMNIASIIIFGVAILGLIWFIIDWRVFDEPIRGIVVFAILEAATLVGVGIFKYNVKTFTGMKYDVDTMAKVYQAEEKHVKEGIITYDTLEHNGWTNTWTYYIVDRDEKKHEYDQYLLTKNTITVEVREEQYYG